MTFEEWLETKEREPVFIAASNDVIESARIGYKEGYEQGYYACSCDFFNDQETAKGKSRPETLKRAKDVPKAESSEMKSKTLCGDCIHLIPSPFLFRCAADRPYMILEDGECESFEPKVKSSEMSFEEKLAKLLRRSYMINIIREEIARQEIYETAGEDDYE